MRSWISGGTFHYGGEGAGGRNHSVVAEPWLPKGPGRQLLEKRIALMILSFLENIAV
jgi:hypothetical protein